MANPTTPILDDFNRPDENPLSGGGNWVDGGVLLPLRLLANQAANGSGGASSISAWAPTTFAADQEGYLTRTVIGGTLDTDTGVVCRQTRGGGKYTGILGSMIQPHANSRSDSLLPVLGIGGGGGGSFAGYARVSVIVNNVNVRIELVPYTIAAGARVWLKCVGNEISLSIDNGAGFAEVIHFVDNTILGGGSLCIYAAENPGRADDFGGGNV